MAKTPNPYRILCLDGGGRWSLISVMALQRVFGPQAKGHEILKQFDLVAEASCWGRWPRTWASMTCSSYFAHPEPCSRRSRFSPCATFIIGNRGDWLMSGPNTRPRRSSTN
jgi:hypothetical protein